jgi:hypothetical protein
MDNNDQLGAAKGILGAVMAMGGILALISVVVDLLS